jgi:hypothetical protein
MIKKRLQAHIQPAVSLHLSDSRVCVTVNLTDQAKRTFSDSGVNRCRQSPAIDQPAYICSAKRLQLAQSLLSCAFAAKRGL